MLEDTQSLENEKNNCPCGSLQQLSDCCLPLIRNRTFPETPEQLMRSRYTAYVLKEIDYIIDSTLPMERRYYPKEKLMEWANQVVWIGLEIVEAKGNQVKFIASFTEGSNLVQTHREWSTFKKETGRWYFESGKDF